MKDRLAFVPTFERVGRFSQYNFLTSLTESTIKFDLVLIGTNAAMSLHSIALWQAFPRLTQLPLEDIEDALVQQGCKRIQEWPFNREDISDFELEPLWKGISGHQLSLLAWGHHICLLPRIAEVTYYGMDEGKLKYVNFQICFEIADPVETFL